MPIFGVRSGPCAVVFAIFELGFLFVRGYYAKKVQKATTTSDYKGGAHEPIFLWVFFALYNVLPALYFVLPFMTFGGYTLQTPATILAGLGAAVYTLGLWVFYRAHADLGRYWSVTLEIRDDHSVVKSGVYSIVRHPMYAAGFLMAIAKALLISNFFFGLAPLLSMALVAQYRIANEEKMLIQQFGADYEEYMAEVGGLLPKWPTPISQSTTKRDSRTEAFASHSTRHDRYCHKRGQMIRTKSTATSRIRVFQAKSPGHSPVLLNSKILM
ncbi:hypothetical protein BSKO_07897 [Bryopsis sp. KO-2023]|nr:hypothetical protein BSKO_07897 [Bryopsis sp. KO-2023]